MGRTVAILGATGAVGSEFISLIEDRSFAYDKIRLLASKRSAGKKLMINHEEIVVEEVKPESFSGIDLVLSSASGTISKEFLPHAVNAGAIAVDNTSAYRMDPDVPLVIPEVNPGAISENKGIIANPNCSTIIMALPLYPLHKAIGVKRVHVSTYQAASGAGQRAMDELIEETQAVNEGKTFSRTVIPHQYAYNLFIHNSEMLDDGYVYEERKMIQETRKIFSDPDISINAVCVRVPVLRAHSEALNIEFERKTDVEEIYSILAQSDGVEILEDRDANRWPMPIDASGKDPVYAGRIRKDVSQENTFDIWVVGDQIRKGAALNAIQIAELL